MRSEIADKIMSKQSVWMKIKIRIKIWLYMRKILKKNGK